MGLSRRYTRLHVVIAGLCTDCLWSWLRGVWDFYGPGREVYGAVYGPGWEVYGTSMVLVGRCMGIVYVPGWEVYNSVYVPGWEVYGAIYGNGWEVYGAVYRPDWEVYGTVYVPGWEVYGTVYDPGWEVYGIVYVPGWEVYEILYGWEVYGADYGLCMVLARRYMVLSMAWLGHASGTGREEYDYVYGYDMYVYGAIMIIDRNMYLTYMSFILFKQIVYVHILKIIRIHTQQMWMKIYMLDNSRVCVGHIW